MPLRDAFGLTGMIIDGRYRVDRVVGEGGFGVVYKATHLVLDGPVALKILKVPETLEADGRAAFTDAFREEGKVLFRLCSLHPSIVQAREAGVVIANDGMARPYLALEWLEGIALDDELRFRRTHDVPPLDLAQAMSLLDGVARGLGTAHEHRIAHRDLKPANVFLVRRETGVDAKLLDFGLAKALDQSASMTALFDRTAGAECVFTRRYGAPEQWLRRLGATGPWTDVHALALVLVELLTLQPALQGEEAAELMGACLDKEVRPTPNTRGARLPEMIDRVFARALAIDPRDRHRTVGEFWQALGDAARSCGVTDSHATVRILGIPDPGESAAPSAGPAGVGVPSGTTDASPLERYSATVDSVDPFSRSRDASRSPTLRDSSASPLRGRRSVWMAATGALVLGAGMAAGIAQRSPTPPSVPSVSSFAAQPQPESEPPVAPPPALAIASEETSNASAVQTAGRKSAPRPLPIPATPSAAQPLATRLSSAASPTPALAPPRPRPEPSATPPDDLTPAEILRERR